MVHDRWPESGRIRPGDHVVFIYDDARELIAFVVPFIRDGLAGGDRCLYVVDDLELTEATEALAEGGVDVTREIERAALHLMPAEEFYGLLSSGASRVVERHLKRLVEATARGFAGLRVAGEMTWVHTVGMGDDTLVEYEALLDEASGSTPLTTACLYRRDAFPAAVLQRLVRSHAKVIADDYVYLSLSAWFQNVARADLQALMSSARERRVSKGGFYFHQGDRATEVYVLTGGAVKLERTDPDGQNIIFRIVKPTEPFGDRPTIGGTTRLSSAQALEDSRGLAWDAATIFQVMMNHPSVSLNAVRLIEDRVEQERDRFQDLATSTVERRLARLLLRLADSMGRKTPQGAVIELSLSGRDLAEMAITTPYTVSRILAGWRRLNIADAQRERILVLDQPRLAAIAGIPVRGDLPPAG
jgi:CRP/FNR family transcriptional regulator, nitrogen oxide reductase regulator